ncbi:MAG: NADP-dependent malic enzyme [Bacteroidales bacterium]|jgi:malate dehydrogenase (oxaloacetate-decarboxylating)|nr:NADP-dependent malic enzyme [Bacteroidales bacterium]MDI9575645.1 NADP-dependent malic enzyme [Bacteroidota bacterium]MDY0401650.1 NADP-dependent malic enzyme [Bacteroidales bacterium]HHW58725.1 NADP-dependent malic enzyme [Bacteroidales bacterium]HOB77132.1 NADP-dependent malic enzyme [Bacteroidales bacterium]
MKNNISLENLDSLFPVSFNEEQLSRAKTIFFKKLSELSHRYYNGKIQIAPKVPTPGFNWFNVWYTPGVSSISTLIRDNNDESFELSNRGNLVAVVSDSTRVLGDGDVTPPGGLGVMEGKAFLMKYLGGIDAVPLCIDSRNEKGQNDPENIIKFVLMVQHSFGAINLEDISQPNCFKVLDTLRESCDIPVWHDDAQGTACVTLAGLLNALKIVNKKIENVKITLYGAGASNTTIARLLIASGADPENIIIFDSKGSLNIDREDIRNDMRYYRKWELCSTTNPKKIKNIEDAMKGADVLISLSKPGPDTIKQEWIRLMADKAIVFACANPVPEIYPYAAKEAGAFVVATGRGDFPNQVNNSLGFPGILKGALMVRSKKITDEMAIAAANTLADFAYKRGIDVNNIMPTMEESEVFPIVAAAVAMEAIKNGVARKILSYQEAYDWAQKDISYARELTSAMIKENFISLPPEKLINEAIEYTINQIK